MTFTHMEDLEFEHVPPISALPPTYSLIDNNSLSPLKLFKKSGIVDVVIDLRNELEIPETQHTCDEIPEGVISWKPSFKSINSGD